jgi:predicted secreted protein
MQVPMQVPNYMTQAILVTVFCCLPIGIFSIIKAKEVNKLLLAGDYAGALAASNANKTLLWIGCISGLVITVFYIYANTR